jgi:hypothetical protein
VSRSVRRLPPVLAPVLIVLAIFGYIVGSGGSGSRAGAPAARSEHIASGRTVVLEYPDSWMQGTASVPGLRLSHPLSLVPEDDPQRAGLVSGQLPPDANPLPNRFLERLEGAPETEVLNLLSVQAYRYTQLKLQGSGEALVLYVIPTPAGRSTALACFAETASSPHLHECEQIVGTLSLVGEPSSELHPDAAYGARLQDIVQRLQRERTALRRRMGAGEGAQKVGSLAAALGGVYSSASKTLARVEVPLAAGATQAALLHALRRARDAYRELSTAAEIGDLVRYEAARQGVETAEREVDLGLESVSLLGYGGG